MKKKKNKIIFVINQFKKFIVIEITNKKKY